MTETKNVKITLTVPEELWKKLSILAIEKKTSKNKLIIEMIQKQLGEGK
jgi:predicted HicB family RNase H-like nuclease